MTNIQEIWKPIKNYEGLYEVSNLGRIKRLSETRELFGGRTTMFYEDRILKEKKHSGGYKLVCLCKNGTNKSHSIHRLVAIAFIPNPENKRETNHKNAIKSDNRVENLEWVTPSENQLHAYGLGIKNLNPPKLGDHYSAKKVYLFDDEKNIINTFDCITNAATFLGVGMSMLSHRLRKHTTTFIGKYFISLNKSIK